MKRQNGFTLAELLVALAVTTLLVVLLLNVVSAALALWEQGRNQIDTFANARQVLERITDEMQGAIAASSPRPMEFSENLSSLKGTTDPVAKKSENVFFVAPYPNATSGDLCVIAYRHNSDTWTVERGFIESQMAWKSGAATRYQSTVYTPTDWQWRTIASGVLEFEIQSYSQADTDASSSPTPADAWNSMGVDPVMLGNAPRRVVVRLRVVDHRTMTKLAGLSPGNATYDRLVQRVAREFEASVLLPPPH